MLRRESNRNITRRTRPLRPGRLRRHLLQLAILISFSNSFQPSHHVVRGPSISKGGQAAVIFRLPSSTTLRASPPARFQEGEEVLVVDDDGATIRNGVIEKKRGGWYTVRLLGRGPARAVKRRGSRLQRKESTPADGTKHASADELPSAMPADVVDLDRILRFLRKQNNTKHCEDYHGQIDSTETITSDTIRQIASCHSWYKRWLIFSDLHVMPSTLPTCLRILDAVHDAARRTDAGILFLGDFWHHRGFVRVDCLNAVLDSMSSWTVPCIMIPGNHDQVDWRGAQHALTPLGNSYRIRPPNEVDGNSSLGKYAGPLIISRPTKFMDALFIPHTRDKATMDSILSSEEAASSSALFVHADVKGALMNDLIRSEHGLPVSAFPANKHVYSGHFHKPHVVGGRRSSSVPATIRYVGSPYQTSFSEAGQAKSLLLVDAQMCWKCVKEIPIDIGPRHHRISSVREFLDLGSAKFRRGDKVSVSVCQRELKEMRVQNETGQAATGKSPFDGMLEELRCAGITVKIRDAQIRGRLAATSPASDEEEIGLEHLSPEATLSAYLDGEVKNNELGEASARLLLQSGTDLLQQSGDTVNDGSGSSSSPSKSITNEAGVTELEIESVSVLGFGPFRQKVVHPLGNRGVLLLRGTNEDFGTDSNGVGKSTLAMASLWALSGSLETRPIQDGKVTDVVNHDSKMASVTLAGRINARPFLVERRKNVSSPGSSLTFTLDGLDLTRQSPRDTQALINEHFGCSGVLMRTIFHGQHAVGGLLESSDARLKDELSHLISLERWQQLASLARSKQRESTRRISELEGMLSLRGKDRTRAEEKSQAAKEKMERRKKILEIERAALVRKEERVLIGLDVSAIEKRIDSVQIQLHESGIDVSGLEEELSVLESNDGAISLLRSKLEEQISMENDARASLQLCQRKHDLAMMELRSAKRQLNLLRSEWNVVTSANNTFSESTYHASCPTCGQEIVSSTAQKHIRENIDVKIDAAITHVNKAKDSISVSAVSYAKAKENLKVQSLEVLSCKTVLHQVEEVISHQAQPLREKIKEARSLQLKLSTEFADFTRKAKEMSESNLMKSEMQANMNRLNEEYKASVVAYKGCRTEVESIKANIAELEREKEMAFSTAALNSSLAGTFGPRGVQAFVLRNLIQALQYCAQRYLDELSEGSLQLRMQMGSNDSIVKQAAFRDHVGTWRVRPLYSLSGGQWRRVSLSLSLGFIDLASMRGKLRSSLLVLDEPLTHLDSAGRKNVGRLLRKMLSRDSNVNGKVRCGLSTILVILQEIAAEEIEQCFDQMDEVMKSRGESFVVLDENTKEYPTAT